ncbi:MAG: class I poly(R)-hydroxyalkanoic acid synthase [Acetobacteraceae bacterium]|nr:class I poly(R)-hydroxyalkanoic acid synthase [Acetobacteraceae bacterium]
MAKLERPVAGEVGLSDAAFIGRSVANIAERSQRIVSAWLSRRSKELPTADPLVIGGAFFEMTARLMAHPAGLMQAQFAFWQDYVTLWHNTTRRFFGEDRAPVIEPAQGDARFRGEAWAENEVFDFIKQSYLLSARFVHDVVRRGVERSDERTARKLDFFTRSVTDALSPSNFVLTNPDVLRRTVETRGENLLRGLNNLLTDLERGQGRLKITLSDPDAFRLGETVAATPGKVVYQNDLMQLIQFAPQTKSVLKRPLLIVPPWINKFYVLDLRPTNSFVRWAVAQGHTVFVVSWVNPDARLSEKGFDDYLAEGVLAALDGIEKATGERRVNAIGYCLGGTLLASALAYMAATGDDRIASATFFVTLVDFSDAGDIEVFIDEGQLAALESRMRQDGYLDGYDMAASFSALRANDLIWSFVINNYLLGKDPFPFDLLFWNGDSTRMPFRMHSFYLRQMYQENKLVEPGGISLLGVPIDLRRITVPSYFLGTKDDHITPWRSTYAGTQLVRGPVRFVLAGSGHVAGIVNPPDRGKYGYWTNPEIAPTPEEWLAAATEFAGSWWTDWQHWVAALDHEHVPARTPGSPELAPIEDAPGSYVRVRAA